MSSLASDIHCGRVLAPSERIVWQGAPDWRRLAWRPFGLRLVVGYFGLLTVVELIQAARGNGDFLGALSPLLPGLLTVAIIVALAVLVSRSTRYLVTDRRVILRYGFALPRSLSLPFSQIASLSVSVGQDQRGDVALKLRGDNHMPYLKLWPHARVGELRHPQPMLRGIAQAGPVATLLARLLTEAEVARSQAPDHPSRAAPQRKTSALEAAAS